MIRPTPVALVIASGFGLSPVIEGNALRAARMPAFLRLVEAYPAMALRASGAAVGLAEGTCGSARRGCRTIGAGRAVFSTEERIRAAAARSFDRVPALRRAFAAVQASGGTIHLIGTVGDDPLSREVFAALLRAVPPSSRAAIHLVLGAGDARAQVEAVQAALREAGTGVLASIAGAAYAADRGRAWERTHLAYEAIVNGTPRAASPEEAVEDAAVRAEELPPAAFGDAQNLRGGDACIFFDRTPAAARGLASAFGSPSFDAFPRTVLKNIRVVTFVDTGLDLPVETAFPSPSIEGTLGETLSNAGLRQLCISETEGFACVTSGMSGTDAPFPGETRAIIPGPGVSRLDRVPEMASAAIADRAVKEIAHGRYDAVIVHLPAPSCVARTGDEAAAAKACEAADRAIGRITEATLALDGVCFLVSDHGAAEAVHEQTQHGHRACAGTANPVPFVVIGRAYEGLKAPSGDLVGGDLANATPSGTLADVAPTILRILGLPAPKEMTGSSLL